MSNAGQAVVTVVGTVIGAVIGGPAGAQVGFQIGLLAGGVLFPTKLPKQFGPRLEDIQTTQAQIGEPIPITYGTFAVPGTVIALGCVTEIERRERVGGKGAPEQTIVNFEYTQTIAVGLCEGEICGVQRIWENGVLKYDIREQQPDEDDDAYAARLESSGEYSLGFTLYLGTEVQEPDPDLELIFGEGLVPGFRGLAYVVFPDRPLVAEQAWHHPAWRFEVVRGPGFRGVVSPTLLDGPLTGFDLNFILADWSRNRYFTLDNVGGVGAEGVRAFTIFDNTEYLQRTYEDIGMVEPIAVYRPTVGVDGYVYIAIGISNDDGVIYKLDPTSLDIVAEQPIGLFQNQWLQSLTTTATAFGLTATFLISVSVLGNHFKVRRADTLGELDSRGDNRESGYLCRGPTGGETAIVWGISCDEGTSGTNDGIDLLKISCGVLLDAFFNPVPAANIALHATIPHSTFQSDWVRVVDVGGLVYDESDDTIVFCIIGANHTGISPVVRRIVKMDPETLEVIWNVEDTTNFKPTFDDNQNLSRIVGGEFVLGASLTPALIRLDLTTGAQASEDWTDYLPGNQTISGAEIWDGVSGCLLTYITDVGPVLICDQFCSDEPVTLGEIVGDVCERCGIEAGGYDVSELTQEVHGFGVMTNMPGRSAIEAVRAVGPFDGVESGLVLKFPLRGRASIKTYEVDELSAHPGGESCPPAVTTDKAQAVELPRIVRVHYLAPSRDYEPGEKLSPSRFTPGVIHELDVDLPVALDDSQALQIAEVIHTDAWAGRWSHEVIVDVSQLDKEPTDVVLLPVDGRLYRARIQAIEDQAGGLIRRLMLVRDDDGAYASSAVADPPLIPFPQIPGIRSESAVVLLDLPPLREEDDDAGIYAAVYRSDPARTWAGAVIHRSNDAGQTWAELSSSLVEATVGTLQSALGPADPATWDTGNALVVVVAAGEFEFRDEASVINGANAVAVGAPGRWEIVQFMDAEVIGDGIYSLTRLLRGRRGTEPYIGTSEAGDTVVLLSDGALTRLPLQTSDIGQAYSYRAASVGLPAGESATQEFTGAGRALLPWAPVMIAGTRAANDLTLTWSRRSRIGSDLTAAGHNLPISDEPEAYEIDVLGGASPDDVVRTLSSSSESVVYTAAQQTTDFGSPQSSISVRVYQISDIVGRGLAGEATV